MSARRATRMVAKPWGRDRLPPPFINPSGARIGEVWFEPPAELDGLLVKYIFTSEALSVQVHPSDAQTLAAGLGRQGKEECWLVIDAEPGAALGIGFTKPLEADAMRAAALDGSIEHLLEWHPVKAGDYFYIPANTVHAIGAGIGGIAAFLLLLRLASGRDEETRMMVGHRALGEFSRVGSVCVLIITGTGLVNAQILVGYENLTQALGSDYGRLLAVKLALVGAMLLLAAKNRWRLTPALGTAIEEGETGSATAALRTSLLLEAGAAVTILALVAWLGTLEPTASMAMS